MNILFLIGKYPNIGGVETVTTVLANAFVERGHKCSIASFEQTMPGLENGLHDSVELQSLCYPTQSRENIHDLRQILVSKKIDIIMNQWCLPYFVTKLCKRAMRGTQAKLIAVHHNAPDKNARVTDVEIQLANKQLSSFRKYFLQLKLALGKEVSSWNLRYGYRYSDCYVVLSGSFKGLFAEFARLKSSVKLSSIGNPLTISSSNFDFNKKEKLIIYVGRIDFNQKRVERIINLWERVSSQMPGWQLKIVGDGPDKERLESIVLEKSLKRISFEGFQDPIEYYKKASVLLLTSEYEGFGLVIVEAMSYGVVPVVYGSYSAVYDIIEDGKDGYITPVPYSEKNMADRLVWLNGSGRCASIAHASISASERFSIDAVVDRWEQLFYSLRDDSSSKN